MRAQQGLSRWDELGPPRNIVIDVDANQQTGCLDHIATVVHELIHIVLLPMFLGWFTDDMEEVGVLAYDSAVIAYIRKSPARVARWTEAINAKLIAADQETQCLVPKQPSATTSTSSDPG